MKVPAARAVWLVLGLFALACSDITNPSPPRYDVRAALHGAGNQHFFFLPPLVSPAQGAMGQPSGTFDADVKPEIRICEWSNGRCAADASGRDLLVAHFTDEIRLQPDREAYGVVWHTHGAGLRDGAVYRVHVLVGGAQLGYADVLVLKNRGAERGVDGSRYHLLTNGAALPIAFRIEKGAVYVAPAAGGTLVTNGGAATINVPAGAVTSDAGLTVFPIAAPPAHPRLIHGTAFDFGPDGTTFVTPVTLTLRYDPAAVPVGIESTLRLAQIVGTQLIPVHGSSVNPATHTVSGPVSHFSDFVVASVPVATVTVAPSSLVLDVGAVAGLAVTVRDPDGNVLTDRELTVSTSTPGIVNAHVVPGTQSVEVEALTAGSTQLTVTVDGVASDPVPITVQPTGPTSITIARSGTDFHMPELGATLEFTATPRDHLGNAMPGEVVTWQLQSPGGAVVERGRADNTIIVDLVALGSGTLFASIGPVTAAEMITVMPQSIQQVAITPQNSNIETGDRITFTATAFDIRGREVPLSSTSWMINGSSVSNLGSSGAANNFVALGGLAAGMTMVSASVMGQNGFPVQSTMMATVNVGNEMNSCPPPGMCPGARVASISNVPFAIELRVSETTTFTATALDAAGVAVTDMMPTVLFTGPQGVATFSWTGASGAATVTVTGAAAGRMTLQVTAGWITYTVPVIVRP